MTAFYRGRQVFQQTIFCPRGLRLVGSEAGDKALPGQRITLPDPGVSLTDRAVTDFVKRVLSSLGGGLALWRAGQRLWAQRLGHCHTYWAMGEELLPTSGQGPDGEVPKDREGGVFDLKPFVAGEQGGVSAPLWREQGQVLKSSHRACQVLRLCLLFNLEQRMGLLWPVRSRGLSLSSTYLELVGGSARCTKGTPGTSCQSSLSPTSMVAGQTQVSPRAGLANSFLCTVQYGTVSPSHMSPLSTQMWSAQLRK